MMNVLAEACTKALEVYRATDVDEEDKAQQRCAMHIMTREGHSDWEIAASCVNILVAATEAPASAIAHTLEELAYNAGVQSKLVDEVHRIVGQRDSVIPVRRVVRQRGATRRVRHAPAPRAAPRPTPPTPRARPLRSARLLTPPIPLHRCWTT